MLRNLSIPSLRSIRVLPIHCTIMSGEIVVETTSGYYLGRFMPVDLDARGNNRRMGSDTRCIVIASRRKVE